MAIELNVGQKVTLRAIPKDANGNPAKVENLVWSVGEGSTAGLAISADLNDPTLITVYAAAAGAGTILCTGDADLGAGVQPISAGIGFTINDPAAKSIDFEVGEPV